MTAKRWQQLGAASGIAYVALVLVGGSLLDHAQRSAASTLGLVLALLSFLCFLVFLGRLSAALRRAEGEDGWLAATVTGSGLVYLAIKLGSGAPMLAAWYRAEQGLDPQLARALQDMNDMAHALTFFPLALLLVAAGIAALRWGALPRWLGWLGVVVGAALLSGGVLAVTTFDDSGGVAILPFALWIVATSVVLLRRAGAAELAVGRAPVSPPVTL